MASLTKSSFGQSMCENCGVQPKFSGFDYCGKTCGAEADKKKRASRRTSTSRAPRPAVGSPSTPYRSPPAQRMCQNCRTNPSFPGKSYCSKVCAVNAEGRRNSGSRGAGAPGPPNFGAGHNFPPYSSPAGGQAFKAPANSNLCEHCSTYVKSEEMDEDGEVITHPYCGIACYKASLEHTGLPPTTIPALTAAVSSQDPLNLRVERLNTPIGRKILLTMKERWKSDKLPSPQVKGLYRINLPGQVYRRFDLALQMNDVFTVATTYYGGIVTCGIVDDPDPSPCASESCELCDALRNSFGNVLYGASCRDGSFGPGLYTYLNPALAHDAVDSDDAKDFDDDTDSDDDPQNYALIQCRVVTQTGSLPSRSSYAGFIDDDSGAVFCAQPTAVIPTHLLTYRLGDSPNSRNSGGFVQTKGVITVPAPPDGGGKAHANLSLQKLQRQSSARGSPLGSPSIKPVDQDLANSAVPASDPATTALRTLVNPNPRGSPLGTTMSPSRAGFDDDDDAPDPHPIHSSFSGGRPAPPSYAPSRASSQQAPRQSSFPLTGYSSDRLGSDRGDERRSAAAAASKYVKPSEDLDSRLDEDDDDIDYLNANENPSGRGEKGQFVDGDSDDDLPDHPPPRA